MPIVLTGATGSIGSAIARALCGRGESVILACRNREKGESLAAGLREIYPDASLRVELLDLKDEKSVRKFASAVPRQLSGVICNAGIMQRVYTTDVSGRELTMSVNFYNTVLLASLLIPSIVKGGSLVFTTSLTRYMPVSLQRGLEVDASNFSQLGTYALSKKALTSAARQLSAEYPASRLRVNCCDPGVVDTGILRMGRWFDPFTDILFRPLVRKPAEGAEPALRAYYAEGTGHIYCRRAIKLL